jgi:hypothetical protein
MAERPTSLEHAYEAVHHTLGTSKGIRRGLVGIAITAGLLGGAHDAGVVETNIDFPAFSVMAGAAIGVEANRRRTEQQLQTTVRAAAYANEFHPGEVLYESTPGVRKKIDTVAAQALDPLYRGIAVTEPFWGYLAGGTAGHTIPKIAESNIPLNGIAETALVGLTLGTGYINRRLERQQRSTAVRQLDNLKNAIVTKESHALFKRRHRLQIIPSDRTHEA